MVHVSPRDSPRGMRQLLYCGLVTTTQVSFYVALKECATSQSRNFAFLLNTTWILFYKTFLLQLSVIRMAVAAPINLADRVCSYFYAHSVASRRSKGSSLWFLPFKTVGAAQSGGLKIQRADRRARSLQPDSRVRWGQRPLAKHSV